MFYNIDSGPAGAFQRMGVLYFTMLLFELLPFCYMSLYVWDRAFFLADRASDLYSTSAYYAAHMAASEAPAQLRNLATQCPTTCMLVIAGQAAPCEGDG